MIQIHPHFYITSYSLTNLDVEVLPLQLNPSRPYQKSALPIQDLISPYHKSFLIREWNNSQMIILCKENH